MEVTFWVNSEEIGNLAFAYLLVVSNIGKSRPGIQIISEYELFFG